MVEILYVAWNRLEFTKISFDLLERHTDWDLVDRLVVYDDGSTDGTTRWLREACEQSLADQVVFRKTKLRSPVAIMVDYLSSTDATIFAKIDNDIAVPEGWLWRSLSVMARHPRLQLLGLAAGWTGNPLSAGPPESGFTYQPSSHIGGVGLMRTKAFRKHPDLWGDGRQGFTQWQHAHESTPRGWITPDLPVVQLDLIPEEPWRSLADYYVSKKWARVWPPYAEASAEWWSWIPSPEMAEAA